MITVHGVIGHFAGKVTDALGAEIGERSLREASVLLDQILCAVEQAEASR